MKPGGSAINISSTTIIKTAAVLIAIFLLYLVKDILFVLLAALILSSAMYPWVDGLQRKKIPRAVTLLFFYSALLLIIGGSVYLVIPPIINETAELAWSLPQHLEQSRGAIGSLFGGHEAWLPSLQNLLTGFVQSFENGNGGIFAAVAGIFGGLASLLLILVIAFYLTAEENSLKNLIGEWLPTKRRSQVFATIDRAQLKIGYWFSGQLFLCFIIFCLTFISLTIMGVKYALVLAIIAGVAEAIPYLGPIIAAVPGILLAFVQSPLLALFVAIIYIIIQQIENNILVPMVMRQAVGLNPITSILALLIGFKLGGFMGAILAIPTATAAGVIIRDLRRLKS